MGKLSKWLQGLFEEPIHEVLINDKLYTTEGARVLYCASGIAGMDTLVVEKLWQLKDGTLLKGVFYGSSRPSYCLLSHADAKQLIVKHLPAREALAVLSSIASCQLCNDTVCQKPSLHYR